MTKRKWTDAQKKAVLDYYSVNGRTPTMVKYKLVGSVLNRWRRDAGIKGAYKKTANRIDVKHDTATVFTHDAIVLLTQARNAMAADMRSGRLKKQDKAHLLMLLALNALTGE